MKTFIAVIAALASVAKGTEAFNDYSLGCYPYANSGSDPLGWKVNYCNGLLNADDCLNFCKCNSNTIVCDASSVKGCSNAQMAQGCSDPYYNSKPNFHWYCYCEIE